MDSTLTPAPSGIATELASAGFADAREVGRGGAGVVYGCYHTSLGLEVAVKVLAADMDEDRRKRFLRAGCAMVALSGHLNIVTVVQVGVTGSNRPYIVMPYYAAGSLGLRLRRVGPIPWPEVVRIGAKLCAALETAHRAGVLHRGIKPANVLVNDDGQPQLADFGMAEVAGGDDATTRFFTDSIAYTAPEVLAGNPVTVAADIYSLGATLYSLIACSPARTTGDLIAHYLRMSSAPVTNMRPNGIPGDVCASIETALSLDPANRQPWAAEFGRQLHAAQHRHAPNEVAPATGPGWGSEPSPLPIPPQLRAGSVLAPQEQRRTATIDARATAWRRIAALVPGLALAAGATAAVLTLAARLPAVSPLLMAIVLGAVASNVGVLHARVETGLAFVAKRLLRIGVALLGLQLVFGDIVGLGAGMLAVVVAIVVLGIGGTLLAGQLLGIRFSQRLLIACGFSICGAAAVAALEGTVEAEEEEVLTALALMVLFGTCMIPLIPLLVNMIGMSDVQAGAWVGGSIPEVAQVVAAGGAIGGGALAVAVVVKLTRVAMLAPVIAVVSAYQRRRNPGGNGVRRPPLVPLFVVGFLACAALRTTGVLPDDIVAGGALVQTALLTAAMFALGAGVNVAALKKVGVRPFLLAVMSTVWVAGIALTGVLLVR